MATTMGKLKCGECDYVGDEHEFIDQETHEQRCPKDGSTFVATPAEIARAKYGGSPRGESAPRKRKKVAA